jgi:hypothetical protein
LLRTVLEEDTSMVVHTIDIAHPPPKSDDAEQMLENELRCARLSKE